MAAFLIIPIFESLKSLMEIRLIIYGLLLLTAITVYPPGIAGVVQAIQERIRRRIS